MIKVELIETWGFGHAIRGMRNPMNSWDKSDSLGNDQDRSIVIGANDLTLMQKLFKGGTEHRKYLRMIMVSMDITAPLYWWKEFDTYKVGTVANSCSTMHKVTAKEFELDDFSHEHLNTGAKVWLEKTLKLLNVAREGYNASHNKDDWWQIIQLLPTSYNQKRTVTMNYENVYTILRQRQGHKLDEWNEFCSILLGLPGVKEIANYE